MKIIDLLNKIAKGEEVPKMITSSDIEECEDMIFIYDKDIQDYKTKDDDYFFEIAFNKGYPVINLEVEIIEEEKEIEKIPYHYNFGYIDCGDLKIEVVEELSKNFNYFADKINELIDVVTEIRKEK